MSYRFYARYFILYILLGNVDVSKEKKMKERKSISHGRVFKSNPQILSVLKH